MNVCVYLLKCYIGQINTNLLLQQKWRVTSTNAAKPVRATRVPPTASNHQKQKGGPVIGKAKAVKRVANVFASGV